MPLPDTKSSLPHDRAEALIADVTNAVYQLVLRETRPSNWLGLQLALWAVVRTRVEAMSPPSAVVAQRSECDRSIDSGSVSLTSDTTDGGLARSGLARQGAVSRDNAWWAMPASRLGERADTMSAAE